MTPTEKRIAIAEAWKGTWSVRNGEALFDKDSSSVWWYVESLKTLNAIQLAVLAQDEEFQMHFASKIKFQGPYCLKYFHQLTASDWCDAFIEVLETRKAKT